MAKYIIVIIAKSKYIRYVNEHKVTDLFIIHVEGERAGMKVYQHFTMNLAAYINKEKIKHIS